jgi:aryl-alcohol dehydrogenase-like predicted oxidoreductase
VELAWGDIRAAAPQYPQRHSAVAAVISGAVSVEEVRANLNFVAVEITEDL